MPISPNVTIIGSAIVAVSNNSMTRSNAARSDATGSNVSASVDAAVVAKVDCQVRAGQQRAVTSTVAYILGDSSG